MVAAVHPAHAAESASTVRYAHHYSALQTTSGTKVPDLTSEVREQKRKVDNLRNIFLKALEGDEYGIAWTEESISGTVQPARKAKELVDAHPYLAWTPAHQSKWAVRGQRRDRSGVGRIRTTLDIPEPRNPNLAPDGRLLADALSIAVQSQSLEHLRPDPSVEVVFEGRHGRPPVILWYPSMALEEVQPPKNVLDAKAAFEKAEEDLARKRTELKMAQEFCAKEKEEWMARDS